jgi:hypothetical protein
MYLPEGLEDTPLKKTLKISWLHMEFVLIFSTGSSRAILGRTAWQQLMALARSLN